MEITFHKMGDRLVRRVCIEGRHVVQILVPSRRDKWVAYSGHLSAGAFEISEMEAALIYRKAAGTLFTFERELFDFNLLDIAVSGSASAVTS